MSHRKCDYRCLDFLQTLFTFRIISVSFLTLLFFEKLNIVMTIKSIFIKLSMLFLFICSKAVKIFLMLSYHLLLKKKIKYHAYCENKIIINNKKLLILYN